MPDSTAGRNDYPSRRRIMNRYFKVGLGLVASVAAGIAVYEIIKSQRIMHEARPPFAEAAQGGED